MSLLTILACKILQDEVIHILKNDPRIDKVLVVTNGQENYFISKLKKEGINYQLLSVEKIPAITAFYRNYPPAGYAIMVYLVELALHERPKLLKSEVYKRIEDLSRYSNGIFLMFGLCGNAFYKVEEDLAFLDATCPVRILKDGTRIIDDCVGASLGGVNKYRDVLQQLTDKGTFLFTPMYAHAWREIMRVAPEKSDKLIEILRRVNEITGYKRVAKIRTGLSYTDNFDKKIDEFAEIFSFEILELEGCQRIFEKNYASMKKILAL